MTIEELLFYDNYNNYCYNNDNRKIKKELDNKQAKELLKEAKYYLKEAPANLLDMYIYSYIALSTMFEDKEKILNTFYNTPVIYNKNKPAGPITRQRGFTKVIYGKPVIFLGDVCEKQKISKIEILNNFIHEMRHVLTYNNETFGIMDDNAILEECYNTYFTEKLMNTILSLNYNFITLPKYLQTKNYFHVISYREEQILTNPIIRDKELSETINKLVFKGKNEEAKKLFPSIKEYTNDLQEISTILDTYIGINEINKIYDFKEKTLEMKNKI